jgi:hypothetical protein
MLARSQLLSKSHERGGGGSKSKSLNERYRLLMTVSFPQNLSYSRRSVGVCVDRPSQIIGYVTGYVTKYDKWDNFPFALVECGDIWEDVMGWRPVVNRPDRGDQFRAI